MIQGCYPSHPLPPCYGPPYPLWTLWLLWSCYAGGSPFRRGIMLCWCLWSLWFWWSCPCGSAPSPVNPVVVVVLLCCGSPSLCERQPVRYCPLYPWVQTAKRSGVSFPHSGTKVLVVPPLEPGAWDIRHW